MDLEIPVGFIHLNFLAGSSLIRLVNVNVMPDLKKKCKSCIPTVTLCFFYEKKEYPSDFFRHTLW